MPVQAAAPQAIEGGERGDARGRARAAGVRAPDGGPRRASRKERARGPTASRELGCITKLRPTRRP
eukprot:328380-Pyramimonas_sp.AAC.1